MYVCVCECMCICMEVPGFSLTCHCLHLILAERCGPPSRPINGYILANFTNMSTSVTFVCQNETQLHFETTTCNELGVWEPDPRDHCAITDSEFKGTTHQKIHNTILLH